MSTDTDATEYPYGRQGKPLCHYMDTATQDALQNSGAFADNGVKFLEDGRIAVLYEAPAKDDPARGHYSVWKLSEDSGMYEQVEDISGDDGMCFERFTETDVVPAHLE